MYDNTHLERDIDALLSQNITHDMQPLFEALHCANYDGSDLLAKYSNELPKKTLKKMALLARSPDLAEPLSFSVCSRVHAMRAADYAWDLKNRQDVPRETLQTQALRSVKEQVTVADVLQTDARNLAMRFISALELVPAPYIMPIMEKYMHLAKTAPVLNPVDDYWEKGVTVENVGVSFLLQGLGQVSGQPGFDKVKRAIRNAANKHTGPAPTL